MNQSQPIRQLAQSWLKQRRHHHLHRAISRAYALFFQRYPGWADYLFDDYFLTHQAVSVLARQAQADPIPEPAALVEAWARQFTWLNHSTRQKHMAALSPVAAEFLQMLATELDGRENVRETNSNRDGGVSGRDGIKQSS